MPHSIWSGNTTASYDAWSAIPTELRELIRPDDDRDEIATSLYRLRAAGLDVTRPDIFALAVEGARNRIAAAEPPPPTVWDQGHLRLFRPVDFEEESVVYYARIGNRVKIGYSLSLKRRMGTINPEELMATEPGGPKLEAERHQQFAALRTHGEWFRLEEPLTTHIGNLA